MVRKISTPVWLCWMERKQKAQAAIVRTFTGSRVSSAPPGGIAGWALS